jgi:hypothetical protein
MTIEELKTLVFYLDGLKYSFQMAELASQRLKATLDEIAQKHPNEYTENQITSCLLDAWVMVDVCHRVRELVQQTPGLRKKLPGIQVFLRGTEQVQNLRNYVQHFRSGIPDIPLQSNPLWGVLSWTSSNDKTTGYTIFSGNLVVGVSGASLPLDVHKFQFAPEIKLIAHGIEIDLCMIAEQLVEVKSCIVDWLGQLPNFSLVKGKTAVLSFSAVKLPAPPA